MISNSKSYPGYDSNTVEPAIKETEKLTPSIKTNLLINIVKKGRIQQLDHLKVLGIKFIVISIIVYSLFGILFNASLINLFWISLLVTGISYLIGDLFVLRKYGNIVASIVDFPLAFLSLWTLGNLFIERGMPISLLSLAGAFFITLCEPLIHAYMQNKFSDNVHENSPTMNQLQTEFAEETDAKTMTNKKKHDS